MSKLQIPSVEEQDAIASSNGLIPVYFKLPLVCPCCETVLVKPEGYVDSYCPNLNCDEQVYGRMRHASSKGALDIDGCGKVMVRCLMENGVRTVSAMLTVNPLFLKPAARKRFLASRALIKERPLWRKYCALGIEGFGKTLAQEVAARWNSLATAFDTMVPGATESPTLENVVGPCVYNSLIDYCKRNSDELDKLDSLLDLSSHEKVAGPLSGKAICITGLFESGSRGDLEKLIEAAGGLVKSSVSKKVSYLLQGGTETGANKKSDAERLGVQVIDEKTFYSLIGTAIPPRKTLAKHEY